MRWWIRCWKNASLNDLDRFHLMMDAIDRLPQTGDKGLLAMDESNPTCNKRLTEVGNCLCQ